jgi:peroxiredoxin Q/BCP
MTLNIGDTAPKFTLPADNGSEFDLSAQKGKKVVVYFYPKDDTSGCTSEAIQFSENIAEFDALNTIVVGISKDSIKSHDKFKTKYDLKVILASDEELKVQTEYGVWVEKSMYGKKYMGTERATFLLDENLNIAQIWRKVKVTGHVQDVLKAIKEI